MVIEVEGLRITGLQIKDFLKEDFLQDLEKVGEVDITALILMKKEGKDKMPSVIVFNHRNPEEIEQKLIHLESPDTESLKKITEILEKKIKK